MPQPTKRAALLPVGLVLAFAAATELLLQALRAFFPLGYHLVGSLGFVLTPVVLLGVFLAPLLYPPLQRLLGANTVPALAASLVVSRLLLQIAPTLGVAILAVAVGLLTMTAVFPQVSALALGPDVIAAGTLTALGLDVALRAWRVTDDVVWSTGLEAWLDPSLWAPALLLIATLPALRATGLTQGHHPSAPVWSWFVLLMPVLLLWGSLAFIGSSGQMGLPTAVLVTLGSVAAAMVVLALPLARLPWPALAIGQLAVALTMPWVVGWPLAALAAAGVVLTPLLLREAAFHAGARQRGAMGHAVASAAAALTMFVLLLLYPLHYEIPLPMDNAWLPGVAVVLACLPLLGGRGEQAMLPREYALPSRLHVPGIAAAATAAVVLAGMVNVGTVAGSLAPGPDRTFDSQLAQPGVLRVATYNTGQGQDAATGGLAFHEVAAAIISLDADVVALQEVARGWPLTSMSDFAAWLRVHTGLEVYYVPAADRQFGNALVSRIPLEDVVEIPLGQGGGSQARSAVRALTQYGQTVYGMHLQARNSAAAEETRLDQMRRVLADWDGRPRTVLAGDLNPHNEYRDETETPPKEISNLEVLLGAGFRTSQPTKLCTEPTSNDNCSDYVMTTPDLELTRPNEILAVDVSDHRPVVADVLTEAPDPTPHSR